MLPHKIIYRVEPDWEKTTIEVNKIKDWLNTKSFTPKFFFSATSSDATHQQKSDLDKYYHEFTPHMKAIIDAWVTLKKAPDSLAGITPKSKLAKFFENNYEKYKIINKKGEMANTVIETLAGIANPKPSGGRPKKT